MRPPQARPGRQLGSLPQACSGAAPLASSIGYLDLCLSRWSSSRRAPSRSKPQSHGTFQHRQTQSTQDQMEWQTGQKTTCIPGYEIQSENMNVLGSRGALHVVYFSAQQ
uniref:Uncharacterized protein n=1 Tax=Aegilops tauschii subsp. strangulata TaxID=200361 RepID=A0A453QB80_AEGTS